eukprot:gnl/MRDRNA2_/MRDRNA2_63386_c0_seq2.p1 gnl/MRDRNA2_/MRDRNA2_63386_c0~~gnl/MRDRNA2_/MRDRNA2_63386_c0_seq2.p1  ORF type:complete len:260 (-),score=47.10 gnl/MRDRNA2_/MRDRNA2_63386_c0_seq2:59-838(-)
MIDTRAALPTPQLADWLAGRKPCPRPASAPALRRWQNGGGPEVSQALAPMAEFPGTRQNRPRTAVGGPRESRQTMRPRDLVGMKRRSSVHLIQLAQEDEDTMSKAIQFGLHVRGQDELGVVLRILKEASGRDKQDNFRAFIPPFNAHRKQFETKLDDAALERKVLSAMKREGGSFGSISDLLQCTPAEWCKMGNLLDGCTLGTVKRCALDYLHRGVTPMDRAATVMSLGWRNPFREHGVCHVPKDGAKVHDEQFMVGAV